MMLLNRLDMLILLLVVVLAATLGRPLLLKRLES
jgi:hypothetical protein